jgi:putative nucleotidyltransferase with HDIG domain
VGSLRGAWRAPLSSQETDVEESRRIEDLIRRFAAAVRAGSLYAPTHPIARRSVETLATAFDEQFKRSPQITIGFLGDDVIVERTRLRGSAALSGFVRRFRERQVEKISFSHPMTHEHLSAFIGVVAELDGRPIPERLASAGVVGIKVGLLAPDEEVPDHAMGFGAARDLYSAAIAAAERVWAAAGEGETLDPGAARTIIDALASSAARDRTSMMALTQIKSHDEYTFTHMVNVSLVTMAQARALGVGHALVREFGLAGLMHDVGKVRIPSEILTKPGQLTDEERLIVQRHVVDGAQMLRKTPEIPALVPIVAFEHHLKHDLSGYPAHVGSRTLNLCTMLVSIADVFDALRSNRSYREGLPANRVKAMLAEQSGTAFEPKLLRRFITLMGLFPVGTVVRMHTGEVGVVTAEHATDPYRPQVRLLIDGTGSVVPHPRVVDTAERTDGGECSYTVLEAVDAGQLGLDPLAVMTT